jgi:S1-C subfamily serine protease
MGLSPRYIGIFSGLVIIGGGAGWAAVKLFKVTLPSNLPNSASVAPAPTGSISPISFRSGDTSVPNFAINVAQKVGPAVVKIDAVREAGGTEGDYADGDRRGGRRREPIERGTGSGFIVSADGRIITNAHVVSGATRVKVVLKDGRSFNGKVVGLDRITDVAAIKIEAQGLPTVELAEDTPVRAGEWAIAIGNPLGLDNSVTLGIISATGRSSAKVGIRDKRVRFIQTDTAINPGNSGGPLLNVKGEVIGINTAIRANAQGLGFSIPIATALRISDRLFQTGKYEHPFVGINMVELTPEFREEIKVEKPELATKIKVDSGVLLVEIIPESPASKAGLQPGDVVRQVGDKKVTTPDEIQEVVEATAIGQELKFVVDRSGQNVALSLRPIAFPDRELEPD